MLRSILNKITRSCPEGYKDEATWRLFRCLGIGPDAKTSPVDDVLAVKACLAAGADINHQDLEGNTPLILAVSHRLHWAARYLLEHGAGPNYTNRDRWSAIMYAARNDDRPMGELLLEFGSYAWNWTRGVRGVMNMARSNGFRQLLQDALCSDDEKAREALKSFREVESWGPVTLKPFEPSRSGRAPGSSPRLPARG
jgi:ankyrin repeat protein